ncbi:hypothetical protein JQ557_18655 [Bradyrhizobium sp. U87765 SZCCT0131]|uniref:hypothetical protein n=1 Tax=unclassified Bradyrhizobium TaxID=2631580 RepID=UPI001BA6DFA2|nr:MULTISPECIES: hypothetical protein [unclassified Bradyrhizobium]MBR1220032.1 hypothetical protein [Bradyrhizobium sp. U87765 SZCCT0131]MBR1263512.1 hypothetical protein [Bradyrhizobium sp. U87765 SZCCT0134]MBR1309081.1 hypothetical protein [Bradyrhizobium sp. U87765 SZCCT0110]MBR1323844.1 hypothetical protein [Bradyrhizobium sp. U87765 SZCCT0109]MBR1349396.1 hypothetical protein [Bradyrhizobium sp. U87765 SZCCT0048]
MMFAATALCCAVFVGFLAHDAFGISDHLIRRDALEGAMFLGLALVCGVLLPQDRR